MRDYKPKMPCVYILASKRNGTLYIGVTSDLLARVAAHKQDLIQGFTKKYAVHNLVYYELHKTMNATTRIPAQEMAPSLEAQDYRGYEPRVARPF